MRLKLLGVMAVAGLLALPLVTPPRADAQESKNVLATLRDAVALEEADLDKTDAQRARTLYEEAAGQGNVEAMRRLGALYAEGRLGGPKLDEARKWWLAAAAKGDAISMYRMSRIQSGKDAVDWLRKSADAGLPMAMRDLALHYARGRDVPLDKNLATDWYLKAADKGDASSMEALRSIFGDDLSKIKRPEAKREWYDLAESHKFSSAMQDAQSGDGMAMFTLGAMFEHGWDGAPVDPDKATYWKRLAYYHGMKFTADSLGLSLLRTDPAKAAPWLQLAVDDYGDRVAGEQLARLYESGRGVPKSSEIAAQIRKTTAERAARLAAERERRSEAMAWGFEKAPKEPLDQLLSSIGARHPFAMMVLAQRLFDKGRDDEAAFWTLAGQARARSYPEISSPGSGEAAAFAVLRDRIGPAAAKWTEKHPEKLGPTLRAVAEWDAKNPDPLLSEIERASARQLLADLAAAAEADRKVR